MSKEQSPLDDISEVTIMTRAGCTHLQAAAAAYEAGRLLGCNASFIHNEKKYRVRLDYTELERVDSFGFPIKHNKMEER